MKKYVPLQKQAHVVYRRTGINYARALRLVRNHVGVTDANLQAVRDGGPLFLRHMVEVQPGREHALRFKYWNARVDAALAQAGPDDVATLLTLLA